MHVQRDANVDVHLVMPGSYMQNNASNQNPEEEWISTEYDYLFRGWDFPYHTAMIGDLLHKNKTRARI